MIVTMLKNQILMMENQLTQMAIVLESMQILMQQLETEMTTPTDDNAEIEKEVQLYDEQGNCLHPSEYRIPIKSMGATGKWVCKNCNYIEGT